MERTVAFEGRDRALGRIDGGRARLAGQRSRQQVGMAEHRLALGKVPHRPSRRVTRTREQVRSEKAPLRLP